MWEHLYITILDSNYFGKIVIIMHSVVSVVFVFVVLIFAVVLFVVFIFFVVIFDMVLSVVVPILNVIITFFNKKCPVPKLQKGNRNFTDLRYGRKDIISPSTPIFAAIKV